MDFGVIDYATKVALGCPISEKRAAKRPNRAQRASREEADDRLAGLLPEGELEKALEGLAPEQITGPGRLLTQLAGRVINGSCRTRAPCSGTA